MAGVEVHLAGLTFNDEIVAVDGYKVNATTFAKRVGDRRPGERGGFSRPTPRPSMPRAFRRGSRS